jgi:hypothetical protein
MVQWLPLIGIVMQAVGAVMMAIQLWGTPWAFDTMSGGLTDKKGSWKDKMRKGLWLYMLGYIPLLWAEVFRVSTQ